MRPTVWLLGLGWVCAAPGVFAADAPPLPKISADAPALTPPTTPITLPEAPKSAVEREAAVELPPMIIMESSKAPPWLYAHVGETEYLSRCSASTTRAYITSQLEIRRMLQVFVPADFFAKTAVPAVSIVAPLEPGRDDVVTQEMLRMEARSNQRNHDEGVRERRVPTVGRFRFLPNLRLDDRDMLAVFTYLNEREFQRENLIAAPDYVFFRLATRTPTLPSWLVEGVSHLYQQASFRGDPITMRAVRWLSFEDTELLRRDPEGRRVLLPPNELFAPDALGSPENQHPTRIAAWRAQALLFVRWALDPAQAPAAESLWQFARRVSVEPPTEKIFIECFGFGYADLQDRLSDYLPVAIKQPARILPGRLPALPRFEVKPATPAQISRLRGEWERLEIPFVRGKHPQFLPKYIEQAQTTLRRAVGRGDRDPQLLAALGLCELDAGDPAAARPWLEQAAAARVVRPRVYYEIARLRWLDLVRDVPENTGFTVAQLQPILEPLRVAAAQTPPLPEVFALMGDAWLRCRERIRATDLPALTAIAPTFRRIPGITFRVALLHIREGRNAEAAQMLKVGLEFISEPSTRAQYQRVLAELADDAKSPTRKTN